MPLHRDQFFNLIRLISKASLSFWFLIPAGYFALVFYLRTFNALCVKAGALTIFFSGPFGPWLTAAILMGVFSLLAYCLLGLLLGLPWENWKQALAWCLLGLQPLATIAWLSGFGEHLLPAFRLELLTQVRFPWQAGFTRIPPNAYALLHVLGLWWIGAWMLLLIKGFALPSLYNPPAAKALPRTHWLNFFLAGGLLYMALATWTTGIYPPVGDEPHYLLICQSLAQDQDMDLANNLAAREYQAFYPVSNLEFHGLNKTIGPLISKHFPGLAVLILPGFWLAARWGAVVMLLLCAAAGLALIARLHFEHTQDALSAWRLWLVLALCAPFATHFDQIFPELPAGILVVLGVYGLLSAHARGHFLTLVSVALLPWLYFKYLPLAAILYLFWLWQARHKPGALIGGSLSLAATAGLYFLFFNRFYQFEWHTNPYGQFQQPFSLRGLRHLLGFIADRDFGVLAASPLLALIMPQAFWRSKLSASSRWLLAGLLFSVVLIYCVHDDFTGTAAPFSRYLIPGMIGLLPFLTMHWWQPGIKNLGLKIAFFWGAGATWLGLGIPLLRHVPAKMTLWQTLGFVPSIFPSLAVSKTAMDWFGASLWVLGWILAAWWLIPKPREL